MTWATVGGARLAWAVDGPPDASVLILSNSASLGANSRSFRAPATCQTSSNQTRSVHTSSTS
jgi:hypothetical protein